MERITQQRLEKLAELREKGVNPYPPRYQRTHSTQEAVALLKQSEAAGEKETPLVSLAGRIMANRPMGKISFMNIQDGAGKIQLLLTRDKLGDERFGEIKGDIDIGDLIGASGRLFRTRTGEPTLAVESFTLLAKSLRPLPEKWHGLSDVELRYRQRYVDLIANPEARTIFQVRSQVVAAVRQFLQGKGFIEVETPVLQAEAGGAAARPFITHHNALDQDFYLRIALELHLKRLIVGGFDKVFEIGRVFRNEGIDIKHNPEFTMLESYEAYADYNTVMEMVEVMLAEVCQQVFGSSEVKFGENIINFKPPWQRIFLRDAVKEHSGIDFLEFSDASSLRDEMLRRGMEFDPKKDRGKLIDWLISTYVEPKLIQPTFLVDYPLDMSPLAKKKPQDGRLVERFEGFAGTMEIANAFSELNDPVDQRQRFLEQQKLRQAGDEEVPPMDEDYLTAMEYGMPPTGGLGIGIDRLVMLFTGQQSIREVILFPSLREKE